MVVRVMEVMEVFFIFTAGEMLDIIVVKIVVILSSSLLAVKSLLVGDVFNVIGARLGDDKCRYL